MGYTPDYIVYHELVLTTKEYMHFVTAVEPEWLAKMGPMFFSIKEDHSSRVKKRREEANELLKMEGEMERAKAKREREKEAEMLNRMKQRKIATPGKKFFLHLEYPSLFFFGF